jgi:flagellar protein FlgJ
MSVDQGRSVSAALAFDTQSLDQLKLQAKSDPGKAVAGAAKQFEGMFLGMVLKSMREATPQDGMFDNEQTKMFTSLLDQQLAQHIASRGTGLSEVMARQLSGQTTSPAPMAFDSSSLPLQLPTLALARLNPEATSAAPLARPATPVAADDAEPDPLALPWLHERTVEAALPARAPATQSASVASSVADAAAATLSRTTDFVNRVWTHAVDAARSIGVQPRFMVGQAALESGWGKHEIRTANGDSSYNLFGVKAGRGWNGPVVEKTTTEYVNGVAQKTTAKFRVYGSYAEAFKDYANLMKGNPRYAGVIGQAQDAKGFAKGLQRAGYATDPAYADKLVRVINGATLRLSLQGEPPAHVLVRR